MRYHALAALLRYNALSVSCILSFSVSQIQPTPYGFRRSGWRQRPWWWVVVAMIPSLSTYLWLKCHPTYVPFQHQLQSPENYHCTQYIRICACTKRIHCILLISHRTYLWIWERQGRRPVGSRWEEVLYTARLKHLVHVRIMCRLKTLRPGSC